LTDLKKNILDHVFQRNKQAQLVAHV